MINPEHIASSRAFPTNVVGEDGLTVREYFAAMAMQGLSAGTGDDITTRTIPLIAVQMADALIEELSL